MRIVFQVLFALTVASEVCCQTLTLLDPKVVSPCNNAARANKDTFTASALGQGLVPTNAPADWLAIMSLDVYRPGRTFSSAICSTVYTKGGCSNKTQPACFKCVNKNNEIVITIQLILEIIDSRRTLELNWLGNHQTAINAGRNYTLPEIVDDSNYNLTLTVHGPTELRTDNLCQFSKYVHTANIFQLCCPSRITPCYAQIILGGTVVARDMAPCVTYVPTSNSTVSMVLKYSLCSKTDYQIGGRCSMQMGTLTTVQTTAITVITQTTAGASHVTTITGPEASTIDGGPKTSTIDDGPETSTIDDDDDEKTTDGPAVTTESAKNVNTGDLGNLLWIIVAIAVLAAILASLAYCIISRRSSRRDEGREAANRGTPPDVSPTPPAQRPATSDTSARTTEKEMIIEERMSMASSSVALTGTDV